MRAHAWPNILPPARAVAISNASRGRGSAGVGAAKLQRRQAQRIEPSGRSVSSRATACVETISMRIAQIAPLIESVPPRLYGGTERIVSYLTEELVRQGHEVTLFASGDSLTSAELVPCSERALRLDSTVRDPLPYYMVMLDRVRRRAHEFDVMHFHIDYLQFPLFRDLAARTLTTQHGRLDLPDLPVAYRAFPEFPLVSISDDQRGPCPDWYWLRTVHHGLPPNLYPFSALAHNGYLAFLGRICPEKRPDHAIEIARRAGLPLKIAAKVDRVDQVYFDEVIRPLLRDPLIEFVGEIGEQDKAAFLGGARALLFPIDWPEPFGLVMIEAMACGTPVIAYRRGSVPEVIEDGWTGVMVDDVAGAVAAVANLDRLDRHLIRARFEQRFTARRMAKDYVAAYSSLGLALELAVPPALSRYGIGRGAMEGDQLEAMTVT
jgi:glycosyltransferase involved in cell wall biosynthesis